MVRAGEQRSPSSTKDSPENVQVPKKRTRSTIACRNCHERRVRCDASTKGIPCSSCIESGERGTCQFIESKRTRGYAGRFAKAKPKDDTSKSSDQLASSSVAGPSTSASSSAVVPRKSPTNTHDVRLPNGQMWSTLLPFGTKESVVNSGKFTYLGESWTLSYVVERTNPRNTLGPYLPLHVPIPNSDDEQTAMETESADVESLRGKGVYELPNDDIQAAFLHAYLEHGYPHYPIVSPTHLRELFARRKVPLLLLQSLFFAGATHVDEHTIYRAGFASRRDAQSAYFSRAKALYDAGAERDKVIIVQSLFLLHSWWSSPTDIVDPLHWLSIAIRLAQSLGMHRSTARSLMSPADRSLWKRIWWCLYARDRQCSSAMGQPMMISDCDCDVEPLAADDFEHGDPVKWIEYAQSMVSLALITTLVVKCRFCPGKDNDMRLSNVADIDRRLSTWKSSLPQILNYNVDDLLAVNPCLPAMMLHLMYNTQLLLLHRPRRTQSEAMEPPNDSSMSTSVKAAQTITRIAEDVMNHHSVESCALHCTSALFAAMTMHVITNANGSLRTCLLAIKALEKMYPSASWIRQIFTRIASHQGGPVNQQRQEEALDGAHVNQVSMPSQSDGMSDYQNASLQPMINAGMPGRSTFDDVPTGSRSSLAATMDDLAGYPTSTGAPNNILPSAFDLHDHATSQRNMIISQNQYGTDLSAFVEHYLLPDTPFPAIVGHPFVGFDGSSGSSLSSDLRFGSHLLESDPQHQSTSTSNGSSQWSNGLPWPNGAQW